MNTSISTMIVVPAALQRAGFKALLQGSGFDVSGETASVADAIALLHDGAEPTLILVECPEADSADFDDLLSIKAAAPNARVAILVDSLPPHAVQALCQAGIEGLLKIDIAPEALIGYINLILLGEHVLHPKVSNASVTRLSPKTPVNAKISERELEVIQHVANGLSNKEIALLFGIMDGTVKIHVRNVQRKLQLKNRTQIAVWAVGNGLQFSNAA
ncbi:MAG: LuxR C-terminal-related transcriptional regulator [Alphaproteobacteria bacterium]